MLWTSGVLSKWLNSNDAADLGYQKGEATEFAVFSTITNTKIIKLNIGSLKNPHATVRKAYHQLEGQ